MPHIQIDYSAHLEQAVRDGRLVQQVHQAALASGVFPVWGTRTFARPVPHGVIGNGDPGNGFVQIQVRIAPGRDLALRQRVMRELFAAVEAAMAPQFACGRIGCQLEVSEFDPAVNIYRNNLAETHDPAEAVVCRRP